MSERMTVPDDGWHEVPAMVMLSVGTSDGRPAVEMTDVLLGTGPEGAKGVCHNRKERP
jgi:hypothetical protein